MSHSDLRRSAAEGERNPTGGTAVTVRVCQSRWPGKTWLTVSQSTYLNPSTHQPPPLQPPHPIHHISLFFSPSSNSYWTFALQKFYFLFKKTNLSTQDTKTPNCFCKTWIAWYSFFLVVVLIWQVFSNKKEKKQFFVLFLTLFSNWEMSCFFLFTKCAVFN